jgi:sterol desaturase/sphingolipid hydroxylase (fatty acid hydroxylase superfamily)
MYERVILWATPAFLLLIAIEALAAWIRRRSPYRLADAINSIGLGQLSTYVGVFTRLLTLGVYVLAFRHARLFTLDAGSPWVWVTALLLYDFLYYWYHRLGHEVNVLWAAHVVHHQSEEFNLSTALRQTGSGFLLSWVFYLPMAVLGVPPEVFLGVGLIDLLYQFWIHTEQVGSLGVFDRLFATPSNHRVHHAVNDLYLDRNYGGILILWDRLFGTFQPELPAVPVVYGTRDPLRSWDPVWANVHTYAALARDSWYARSWSDKLRVWIKHPGWRPADVAARFPKPPFRLGAVSKFERPLPSPLAAYCLVQAILVLAFGTHYLAVAPHWALGPTLGYLAGLVASLWIVGGLTEGRRTFVWLETLRIIAAAAVVVVALRMGAGLAPAAAAVVVVAAVLCVWLWRAARALPQAGAAAAPA